MNLFSKSLLSVCLSLVFATSASASGQERGGGSRLQAGFKVAAKKLGLILNTYPQEITAKYLKFEPTEFLSAASSVNLSCAEGVDLDYLRREKILAYVKGDGTPNILLNCYVDSPRELDLKPDWHVLLEEILDERKSLSSSSKVLLAHEVLRTYKSDRQENSYLSSGSIVTTEMIVLREQIQMVQAMYLAENNNTCRLKFHYQDSCDGSTSNWYPVIHIERRESTRHHFQYIRSVCDTGYTGQDSTRLKSEILDPIDRHQLTKKLYSVLSNLKCFQNINP